jgi:hypothetical protein
VFVGLATESEILKINLTPSVSLQNAEESRRSQVAVDVIRLQLIDMHSVPPESEHCSSSSLKSNQSLTCSECGKFDATDFGHTRLCLDCYAAQGSCCALEQEARPDKRGPEKEPIRKSQP